MQLGTHYDSRRFVFAVGNFSILDFFDTNAFDIDPRQGFLSLGFMTYAAYDFASDARGYSYGGIAEFHWDDWAFRVGRITRHQHRLSADVPQRRTPAEDGQRFRGGGRCFLISLQREQ